MNYLINGKECPVCGENFVDNLGLQCGPDCLDKKLERKHRNIARKMVNYCLKSLKEQRIKLEFPLGTEDGSDGGGTTIELNPTVAIPGYTLRNKKEFFDTVSHEIAHVTVFRIFFDLANRKILKKFEKLKEKSNKQQVEKFSLKHQKLINRYKDFLGEVKKICCHGL